jgi:hypothetical protein
MKPSVQYRRDAEALRRFREAYVRLMNSSRPQEPVFATELGPGVSDERWSRLRTELSLAAGAAIPGYNRHGGVFALRNAAYSTSGVDPVSNWELSLRHPGQLPPQSVVSAVDSAIGLAETRAADAEEREKGLIGLIAAFLRWPTTLRDAVGPDHALQRRAAGAVGVIGQVIVGVIATLLASGMVAAGFAIWRAVT